MFQKAFLALSTTMLTLSVVGCAQTPSGQQSILTQATDERRAGNFDLALKLLRPLAEDGDLDAQSQLGLMYFEGDGVVQDSVTAAKWYTTCADRKFAMCQLLLGDMYRAGVGVPQDLVKGLALIRKAAEQGYLIAFYDLAGIYTYDAYTQPSFVQAYMWSMLAEAKLRDRGRAALFYEDKMTTTQIALARRLATECEQRRYKDC